MFLVENLNNDGDGSLRWAIEEANANPGKDTIPFAKGLEGTIDLITEIVINDNLVIKGPGVDAIVLDGMGDSRIIAVTSAASASISGLAFVNGMDVFGGGAITSLSGTSLSLQDVVFTDNQGGFGGAVEFLSDGKLTIRAAVFAGNSSDANGGGLRLELEHATARVMDSLFAGNEATRGGGAEVVAANDRSRTDWLRTQFFNNTASTGNGGAVHVGKGDTNFIRSTFAGGLRNDSGLPVLLQGTKITGNHAPSNPNILGAIE